MSDQCDESAVTGPLDGFFADPVVASHGAVSRFEDVLNEADFPSDALVLNGFGAAYPDLNAMARQALGSRLIEPDQALDDASLSINHFVGAPDRFFILCQSGFAQVLRRAIVAGGAVFPVVRQAARDHDVALWEVMSDPFLGPYAVRVPGSEAYALHDGLDARLVQPGGDKLVPDGMVGELVLREDATAIRTGILSAMEKVPHNHRAPGLQGWLGYVQAMVQVGETSVELTDLASFVDAQDEVLAARLQVINSSDASVDPTAVLQVETEAGDWIDAVIEEQFQALTGLLARVERVTPGQLPNTGRVFA